jgi:hypothetical protein
MGPTPGGRTGSRRRKCGRTERYGEGDAGIEEDIIVREIAVSRR